MYAYTHVCMETMITKILQETKDKKVSMDDSKKASEEDERKKVMNAIASSLWTGLGMNNEAILQILLGLKDLLQQKLCK